MGKDVFHSQIFREFSETIGKNHSELFRNFSFPPALIVEIPLNGASQSYLMVPPGFPTELTFDLPCINRVAEIMAGTVRDKGDLLGEALPFSSVGFQLSAFDALVEQTAKHLDQVNVP